MKNNIRILTLLLLSLFSNPLWAHAKLDPAGVVPPRSDNAGIKVGPCGADAPSTPTPFHAGSTIVVSWIETIDHPGEYRFSFSNANDENFVLRKTVVDTQNGGGLVNHTYSTSLQLPTEPCSQCTLQMIQVMTDRNPPTNYYSCADIAIIPLDQPLPGGGGNTIPDNLNLAQKCTVMMEDFTSFDTDVNYQLSFTEIENSMNFLSAAEFTQVDGNGDGYLQMSEIQAIANPPANNNNNNNDYMAGSWGVFALVFLLLTYFARTKAGLNIGSDR